MSSQETVSPKQTLLTEWLPGRILPRSIAEPCFRYKFSGSRAGVIGALLAMGSVGILTRSSWHEPGTLVALMATMAAYGFALLGSERFVSTLYTSAARRRFAPTMLAITRREIQIEEEIASALQNGEASRLALAARIRDHIQDIADTAAAKASTETGTSCAASVKMLCLPSNLAQSSTPEVVTIARDARSAGKRLNSPHRFPYNVNTAFEHIVNSNSSSAIYACSDLLLEERLGRYRNANELWKTKYNSTLVIPICDFESKELDHLYGFFCIDTYAGDVTRSEVRNLMTALAGYLYRALALLSVLQADDQSEARSAAE